MHHTNPGINMANGIQIKKGRQIRSKHKTSRQRKQKPRSENTNQSKLTKEQSIRRWTEDKTGKRGNQQEHRSKQEGSKLRVKSAGLWTDLGEKWERRLNEKLTELKRSAPNRMIDLSLAQREAVLHNQMRIRELWGLYFYKPK